MTKLLTKRLLKISLFILGILVVLLVGFHFWFKAHAKGLIEDLVKSRSHGKIKLKIGKFHFSYFSKKIELENAVFYSTDTVNSSTSYRFSVERIKLRAKAILPIVFEKRILIDSLNLYNPRIEVTRLRAIEKPDKKIKKDVSIPEEMGKVYASIQDALQVLKVQRFQIEDGTFTLINKIDADQLPLRITNLYFHIDNLKVDSSSMRPKEKILFSDNIAFRSHNQNILFPDGRHRLSFSQFRINLEKKIVEFDSCTIAATRGDSTGASFDVFFDALVLTNIDFDTLYKSEVIKADSVYCVNPRFNLEVTVQKKKEKDRSPLKLENIIKQLTGDLQLKYVIVTNADFNIKTIKDGNPSSFTFSKNNFEMQGLDIDQEAEKPIKVKSFMMAIRNYENFIKDSSYSIKFDSILFKNDKITLSNFLFNKLENGKIINSLNIPQFLLQGLSWDDLVLEKKLKAEQAIMFSPNISYTSSGKKKKVGSQNIFQSLGAVNEFMDLKYLDIVDGNIDLKLKNDLHVRLENADLSIQSNSLLTSTKFSSIKNSLTSLSFKKGSVQAGSLTIHLDDIHYTGKNGEFAAGSMVVNDRNKNIAVDLKEVQVDKMLVDEISGDMFADGVNWQSGHMKMKFGNAANKKDKTPVLELRNVHGSNTSVDINAGSNSIHTKVRNIAFSELIQRPGKKPTLIGLTISGNDFTVKDKTQNISVTTYSITDKAVSSLQQVSFRNKDEYVDAVIKMPSVSFVPHVQSLINGDIVLDAMSMVKPVFDINIRTQKKKPVVNKESVAIRVNDLKMTQPSVNFSRQDDSSNILLNWQGQKNASNFIQVNNLMSQGSSFQAGDISFYLSDLIFRNSKGRTFNTGEGKLSAQVKNASFEKDDAGIADWKGTIARFDASDFHLDSVGRSNASLVMNKASFTNLKLSTAALTNLQKLASSNKDFGLQQFTGHYSDAKTIYRLYNAAFNRQSDHFSMDSFSFRPVLERDSFLAKQEYQTDYIKFRSGHIDAGPVDLDALIKKNIIKVGTVKVDEFFFSDYKDKELPFNPGIIKPLPVDFLKKITQKFSVDSISFTRSKVEYTETGVKTKLPATFPVTRLNVRFTNVNNYSAGPTDSLGMQATGYLLDSVFLRLKVKQSYTDTLGGFLVGLQVGPADMRILNPVLLPLAMVEIESGTLDTLSMRAVGREYLALGEMQMYYHDLKIRLLKDGNKKRGLLSGLANLLIKNKNESRTGNVFFIRKRDRSAINYLVKIAASGVASSVGVKKNKKMMKKYKKEFEERNLQSIDPE